MSTGITPDVCTSEPHSAPHIEASPARHTQLGPIEIRRLLPLRERRMVGPWCFLDRYGPLTFDAGHPMDVPPHPHIGLQTVTWLLDGEVLHRDSLGSEVMLRPGGLNLMTSGRGIAHSEDTPAQNSGRLNGVQLWVALRNESRHGDPMFESHPELPEVDLQGGRMKVIIGGVSPATTFSPIIGAELQVESKVEVPLRKDFEHALLLLDGNATIDGEAAVPDVLYYLGTGRDQLSIKGSTRILLLGGAPFGETILMWWNFVARTHEEIVAAGERWMGGGFGQVRGAAAPPTPLPSMKGPRPPAAS